MDCCGSSAASQLIPESLVDVLMMLALKTARRVAGDAAVASTQEGHTQLGRGVDKERKPLHARRTGLMSITQTEVRFYV